MNLRKIGMTARAFAFASLSPKPNLDANHSTWRGKHMLGISWICRKCQRHPEAVKQSLTPRTHQRGMMKLCSEGEKKNKNNGQYRSTKTSMMTTECTTTKSRVVPQYQIFFDKEPRFSFAFLCLFGIQVPFL